MPKDTEFTRGISFEENPFECEEPDHVQFYDMDGNEVTVDHAK